MQKDLRIVIIGAGMAGILAAIRLLENNYKNFTLYEKADQVGGTIITDWYSNNTDPNETIKITIRFLSNEIRSDAIDINVFYKKCEANNKCVVQKNNKNIESELRKEILKKATIYQKQTKSRNKSFYPTPKMGGEAR